jgi:hypothetical protein
VVGQSEVRCILLTGEGANLHNQRKAQQRYDTQIRRASNGMADIFGQCVGGFVLQGVMAPRSHHCETVPPIYRANWANHAQEAPRTYECLIAAWNSIFRTSAQPVSLVACHDLRNRASRCLWPSAPLESAPHLRRRPFYSRSDLLRHRPSLPFLYYESRSSKPIQDR